MSVNILRAWRLNKITGSRRWAPDRETIAELTREFERRGGKIFRVEDERSVPNSYARPMNEPKAIPAGFSPLLYAPGLGPIFPKRKGRH